MIKDLFLFQFGFILFLFGGVFRFFIEKNITNRDRYHHKNKDGFGDAEYIESSSNKDAIRGYEQRLIDNYKAQNKSGNAINGISDKNPKKDYYVSQAQNEFGGSD